MGDRAARRAAGVLVFAAAAPSATGAPLDSRTVAKRLATVIRYSSSASVNSRRIRLYARRLPTMFPAHTTGTPMIDAIRSWSAIPANWIRGRRPHPPPVPSCPA